MKAIKVDELPLELRNQLLKENGKKMAYPHETIQ